MFLIALCLVLTLFLFSLLRNSFEYSSLMENWAVIILIRIWNQVIKGMVMSLSLVLKVLLNNKENVEVVEINWLHIAGASTTNRS